MTTLVLFGLSVLLPAAGVAQTPTRTPTNTRTPTATPFGPPSVDVGTATGLPGDTVSVPVTLTSRGNPVTGTSNIITFDSTQFDIANLCHGGDNDGQACLMDSDCPNSLNLVPCGPDCNAAAGPIGVGKMVSGSRRCTVTNQSCTTDGDCSGGETCNRLIIGVLGLNNNVIPDGLLYSCNFQIFAGATPNMYALTNIPGASNSVGDIVPTNGNPGSITVSAGPPTNTPSFTPTNTPSVTNTPTNTPTVTQTPTRTPSNTPTITLTPTMTGTITPTPIASSTPTLTATITGTPTRTPTVTQTPTITNTPVLSPTTTPTRTQTLTPSITATPTITPTRTNTPPPSSTPTVTPTSPPPPPVLSGGAVAGSARVFGIGARNVPSPDLQIWSVGPNGMPDGGTGDDVLLGSGGTDAQGNFFQNGLGIPVSPPLKAGDRIFAIDQLHGIVGPVVLVAAPVPAPAMTNFGIALLVLALLATGMWAVWRRQSA